MKEPYLEVTYRRGQPLAAYYYLPNSEGLKSHRTRELEPGLVVDFARDGRALGIEITEPARLKLAAINRVLRQLGERPLKAIELGPLRAA